MYLFREHACKGKISSGKCLCASVWWLCPSSDTLGSVSVPQSRIPFRKQETQMPQSGESQHFPEGLWMEVLRETAFLPSRNGAEIHRGCTQPWDKWDSAVAKHHLLIPSQIYIACCFSIEFLSSVTVSCF